MGVEGLVVGPCSAPGDAEVGDDGAAAPTRSSTLPGLEIAVHDAGRRGPPRGPRRSVRADVDGPAASSSAGGSLHARAQALALDVLHGQEAPALKLAEVVGAGRVAMGDAASEADLPAKALDGLGRGRAGVEELERDDLGDLAIVDAKHRAHAPAADELLDLVATGEHVTDRDAGPHGDRDVVALGHGHGRTVADRPRSLPIGATVLRYRSIRCEGIVDQRHLRELDHGDPPLRSLRG